MNHTGQATQSPSRLRVWLGRQLRSIDEQLADRAAESQSIIDLAAELQSLRDLLSDSLAGHVAKLQSIIGLAANKLEAARKNPR